MDPEQPGKPAIASGLVARRVAIDTYRENVVYLHRDCNVYRAEEMPQAFVEF